MATYEDVQHFASALPDVTESPDGRVFSVVRKGKLKGFVWPWAERVHPKKARVINVGVIAVSVPNLTAKEMLLGSGHPALFTEPHYNGFPAVLVRLDLIDREDLEPLIIEGWRSLAGSALVTEYDMVATSARTWRPDDV